MNEKANKIKSFVILCAAMLVATWLLKDSTLGVAIALLWREAVS